METIANYFAHCLFDAYIFIFQLFLHLAVDFFSFAYHFVYAQK